MEPEGKQDSEVELVVHEPEVDEPEVKLEADPPNIKQPTPPHTMHSKCRRVQNLQIQLG